MGDRAVRYDLHMSALMRCTLARHHREDCACPARTKKPLLLPDAEVKLVALTRDELESIAACARWAFVLARGTERRSLRGLMRRTKAGIDWIDEQQMRAGIPPHENVATKAGRRAVADELSEIAATVDEVWSCETNSPRGQSPAQVLVDELEELAERLRA